MTVEDKKMTVIRVTDSQLRGVKLAKSRQPHKSGYKPILSRSAVRQGALGTCYFDAAMLSILSNPYALQDIIQYNEDDTATVTCYNSDGLKQQIIIDRTVITAPTYFPVPYNYNDESIQLVLKAFAIELAREDLAGSTSHAGKEPIYDKIIERIDGGWSDRVFQFLRNSSRKTPLTYSGLLQERLRTFAVQEPKWRLAISSLEDIEFFNPEQIPDLGRRLLDETIKQTKSISATIKDEKESTAKILALGPINTAIGTLFSKKLGLTEKINNLKELCQNPDAEFLKNHIEVLLHVVLPVVKNYEAYQALRRVNAQTIIAHEKEDEQYSDYHFMSLCIKHLENDSKRDEKQLSELRRLKADFQQKFYTAIYHALKDGACLTASAKVKAPPGARANGRSANELTYKGQVYKHAYNVISASIRHDSKTGEPVFCVTLQNPWKDTTVAYDSHGKRRAVKRSNAKDVDYRSENTLGKVHDTSELAYASDEIEKLEGVMTLTMDDFLSTYRTISIGSGASIVDKCLHQMTSLINEAMLYVEDKSVVSVLNAIANEPKQYFAKQGKIEILCGMAMTLHAELRTALNSSSINQSCQTIQALKKLSTTIGSVVEMKPTEAHFHQKLVSASKDEKSTAKKTKTVEQQMLEFQAVLFDFAKELRTKCYYSLPKLITIINRETNKKLEPIFNCILKFKNEDERLSALAKLRQRLQQTRYGIQNREAYSTLYYINRYLSVHKKHQSHLTQSSGTIEIADDNGHWFYRNSALVAGVGTLCMTTGVLAVALTNTSVYAVIALASLTVIGSVVTAGLLLLALTAIVTIAAIACVLHKQFCAFRNKHIEHSQLSTLTSSFSTELNKMEESRRVDNKCVPSLSGAYRNLHRSQSYSAVLRSSQVVDSKTQTSTSNQRRHRRALSH